MIKVYSTRNVMFLSHNNTNTYNKSNNITDKKINETKLVYSAAALSCVSATAAIGFGKIKMMNMKNALKKNGVELKNGIATIIDTGERYNGNIEHFVSVNKKEVVKYVNGEMSEKLYYNLFGKELDGYFYKNGKQILKVGQHTGKKVKSFAFSELINGEYIKGDVFGQKINSVFGWAREHLKELS